MIQASFSKMYCCKSIHSQVNSYGRKCNVWASLSTESYLKVCLCIYLCSTNKANDYRVMSRFKIMTKIMFGEKNKNCFC